MSKINRYVPRGVQELLEDKNNEVIKGYEVYASILFADLRNSTSMSEKVNAYDLIRLLNIWTNAMGNVIDRNNGIIVDFVGDEIVVAFGALKENGTCREDSVRCAVEMQKAMEKVNALLEDLGFMPLSMGIGIHAGPVAAGTVGTSTRYKFDVIGKNVNMAARIQSKARGGQILISEEVKLGLKEDSPKLGEVFQIEAKGISAPIEVYDVIDY